MGTFVVCLFFGLYIFINAGVDTMYLHHVFVPVNANSFFFVVVMNFTCLESQVSLAHEVSVNMNSVPCSKALHRLAWLFTFLSVSLKSHPAFLVFARLMT